MKTGKELRFFISTMEVRKEGDTKKIRGYAAKFNELSDVLYGVFREKIKPGAFTNALKKSDVRALFNHDPNYVLGRTNNGTLILTQDEVGLRYEITPPETQWAKDLTTSIERGDINQSSFAFRIAANGDEWDESQDIAVRTIIEFDELFDVSPVTYPAYPTTSVGVRSAEDVYKEYRQAQEGRDSAEGMKAQEQLSVRRKQLELKAKEI